jgi:hypothetical protein
LALTADLQTVEASAAAQQDEEELEQVIDNIAWLLAETIETPVQ